MKSKKGGIIFFIIISVVFILLVFIYQNKGVIQDRIEEKPAVDLQKMAGEYKESIKLIKPLYEDLISRANENLQDKKAINNLRSKLLELKMPAEFREAHVELVLLLDKIEQGISGEEAKEKFKEIIERYEWLNF